MAIRRGLGCDVPYWGGSNGIWHSRLTRVAGAAQRTYSTAQRRGSADGSTEEASRISFGLAEARI